VKQWMQKLIDQFNFEFNEYPEKSEQPVEMSEERATLLYILDIYNKHLLEIDRHPVRKTREALDELARLIMQNEGQSAQRVLFRLRQFFSDYRLDEYAYVQKTFNDFREIIWEFADQLSEDLAHEQTAEEEIEQELEQLKEAVEANSIDVLKSQSQEFIDSYVEYQVKKDKRRTEKVETIKKNLETMKKKLVEANHNMRLDHLTSAYNRKSFDERMLEYWKLFQLSPTPISLMMLDIDHFKRVNDTYGHQVGDFVLVELVKTLHKLFYRESDFIARIGGEEFAIILPDYKTEHAVKKAETTLKQIRETTYVEKDYQIKFTISIGIAELKPNENVDQWIKRADSALYYSKNSGRDRYTISGHEKATKAA
jgi:diguanylate cyclase